MEEFERIKKIITEEDFKCLENTKILIIGIGGVGGYALETIIRSGIRNITIVDADKIDISNFNRQIIATSKTIGMDKCTAYKKRAEEINPKVKIKVISEFILENNISKLFNTKYDYIIDACDTISTKIALIKMASEKNIKIISCMGVGNKFDPTKLSITKLSKTSYDPVAKAMRKILKEQNINQDIFVVSSTEKPVITKDRIPGSMVMVPAVAGIYCASFVINNILNKS